MENLEWYLSGNSFKLQVIHYGGLAGMVKTNYSFRLKKDSVAVSIYNYPQWGETKKLSISHEDYKKIEHSFQCLVENHHNEATPTAGCQPPFYEEFYIKKRFRKMRMYNPEMDFCDFQEIIFNKRNFPERYNSLG